MKTKSVTIGKPRLNLLIGFTLLELLVVIAIVAVLTALLLPAIARSKRSAQQAQCVGNLRQLGISLQSFVADNHAYPSVISGTNGNNPGTWMTQLDRGASEISKPHSGFLTEGVWRCPSARWGPSWQPGQTPTSYGYNAFGVLPIGNRTNALGLQGRLISNSELFASVGESEVVNPSEMMAVGDSLRGGFFFMRSDLKNIGRAGFASRHQGKVNVMYCDGHVESPTLHSVFEDTNTAALVRWNRDHQSHLDKL